MNIGIAVSGIEELNQKLIDMAEGVRKGLLTELVLGAAAIVADEAQANAPSAEPGERTPRGHKPGTLKARGIGYMVLKRRANADQVSAGIGFTKKGWYGIFSEFGTSRQTAHPFVVPAFERKRDELFQQMGKFMATYVDSWKSAASMGTLRRQSFSKTY